ncbi:hypothetical protein ABZ401_01385, partial [Streptomyces sp. NPDC005892]|uniref:hypothetical protein n=1 Tax=Streptomyces sp. NPDC005892 TaxID=3155593 RepID=UPI00340CE7F8
SHRGPPGASLRSCVSDSIRHFHVRFPVEAGQAVFAFQFFAFAFPFPAVPTLPDSFSFRFRSDIEFGDLLVVFAFRLTRLYQSDWGRMNDPNSE